MGAESEKSSQKEDELAQFLSTYETGPQRSFFKTTPSATLVHQLSKFTKLEKVFFAFLIFLTLFVRLYRLDYPDSVVFDEVHFGGFASKYINGKYFVDVHPPLVKLVYYLISKLNGDKGDFDFSKIGRKYVDQDGHLLVSYLPMRLFSALCGAGTVFLTYKTAKISGCRPLICFIGSLICCLENSLVTQSRFILLDSPLVFFISLVVFSYKLLQVCVPFTKVWFRYLCLLGFSLGLAISSKLVAIFTFMFIGLLTLRDFWYLVGDLSVDGKNFFRHITSRVYFLIVTPLVFYLGFFAIHFLSLPKVGDGTAHMSPRFQNTLENSIIHDYYSPIMFGSSVSIRHIGTGGYLHSHNSTYPKTGNQQVTLYGFQDYNNEWLIEKKMKTTPEELFEKEQNVPNLQRLKLFHKSQKRYLRVNDQRPPISEQDYNNEVTLIGDEQYLGDGDNEVFEIKLVTDRSKLHPDSEFELKAVDSVFQIYHVGTGCYLFSHDTKLPAWGFNQYEVTCIEKPTMENSLWYFEKNTHPKLHKEEDKLDLPNMNFWDKIKEVHQVMIRINNGLTQDHSFASDPISWPFLTRGVSYWGEENKNVYFLGNYATYLLIVVMIIGFFTFNTAKFSKILKPSFFSVGENQQISSTGSVKYINNVAELILGWALHYFPSFLMQRQLFIHHYLPSLYFGILIIIQTLEFIVSKSKIIGYALSLLLTGLVLWCYWNYTPIIYGLQWSVEECLNSKLLPTWDINCYNYS